MSIKFQIIQDKKGLFSGEKCSQIDKLQRSVQKFLKADIQINIVLVSASFIKKLNYKFRKKNKPTDVLSFNINDNLAEIYICPSFIKKNLNKGVPFDEELARMIIHGTLHVLGYDHKGYFIENREKQEKMFALQEKILHYMCK